MKPEQINHAIHKHFGWEYVPAADGWRRNTRELHYEIPNYHGDLNAMHEAERTLTSKQPIVYIRALVAILDHVHSNGEITLTDVCDDVEIAYHCTVATSPQRAEAFLRTVGKWNDQ